MHRHVSCTRARTHASTHLPSCNELIQRNTEGRASKVVASVEHGWHKAQEVAVPREGVPLHTLSVAIETSRGLAFTHVLGQGQENPMAAKFVVHGEEDVPYMTLERMRPVAGSGGA